MSAGLRKLCNEKKILLILDEVQCGIGRTGKLFAFEWAKIKPDIVPIAKGIGGGFPIGACLMEKKVAEAMNTWFTWIYFWRQPFRNGSGFFILDYILSEEFLANVTSRLEISKGSVFRKYNKKISKTC